ncbi:MAG: hypothetical protein ABJD97_18760, partial [Betaproteobacteria bacterium]
MNPHRLSYDTPGAGDGARPGLVAASRASPITLVSHPAPAAFVRYGAGRVGQADRRMFLLAMLGLHIAAVAGLMNLGAVRESVAEAAALVLAVLAPPPPVMPPRPLPPPTRSV